MIYNTVRVRAFILFAWLLGAHSFAALGDRVHTNKVNIVVE